MAASIAIKQSKNAANPALIQRQLSNEFLKLAGVYLACRWKVMGNRIPKVYQGTFKWSLLGMLDYEAEMKLVINDIRNSEFPIAKYEKTRRLAEGLPSV
jgi:hypothetical protein